MRRPSLIALLNLIFAAAASSARFNGVRFSGARVKDDSSNIKHDLVAWGKAPVLKPPAFLKKAYGRGLLTGACALLMFFSMVINESLVARTFGTYVLQLFDSQGAEWLIPALGVSLLIVAFIVNILSNQFIQTLSFIMAFIKIAGLAVLAIGGLWATGLSFESVSAQPQDTSATGFLGAVALGILGYKGFTTITNSGGELKQPEKNVGRAIVISISICVVLYVFVAVAVGANLSIGEIIQAKDYSLAEASRETSRVS